MVKNKSAQNDPQILLTRHIFSVGSLPTQLISQTKHGLVGLLFDGTNLTRTESFWYLEGVDLDVIHWPTKNDFSGQWLGFLKALASGIINFYGEADSGIIVKFAGNPIIDTWNGNKIAAGSLEMVQGRAYDIEIINTAIKQCHIFESQTA